MRALLLVLMALALGGLVWMLAADGEAPPPMAPGETDQEPRQSTAASDPLTAERIELAEPDRPEVVDNSDPETGADEPEIGLAPGMGRLRLEVWDRTEDEPVEAFRYVMVRADGERDAAPVEGHELTLDLPLDGVASLTIEAEGFEPSDAVRVQPTAAVPEVTERVWLIPASRFSGVELRVQTPALQPVQLLDVQAFAADPATGTEQLMWRRRAEQLDGIYRLPDFKPGSYRLRLRAVTGSDGIATFRPHDEPVEFGGTESIRRDIVLQAGCVLQVTAHDGVGNLRGAEVALQLVRADDTTVDTIWVATIDGEVVQRVDGLPGTGPAQLADPLPPGTYRLRAQAATGEAVERVVQLQVGQRVGVTLTLE